ncbi:uncharacterized protein LOC105248951 [Camponotus floridanus]|uniref:uncharacterized protein LOC105248951 n=1 Tax=Camponotus floridanus TaxID=104421 RepID=UPI000DC676E6|nr:uncharacterized protein LOC105248951 [Camponotus floridanus]XP_011252355.2 uncharacterized protein LOC105248951 [Camponotus floridanus]
MAANNEMATNTLWEEMKNFAIEQQQCFYELLLECTAYKSDEHEILKKNIGYAIYGLPTSNENESTIESNKKSEDSSDIDANIVDTINYDEKAKKVIDILYNKICKYTIGTNMTQPIYFGIIYNVIFSPKINVNPKEEKEVKKEENKETNKKTEIKEPVKEEEKEFPVLSIPIFTIRRNIEEKSTLKNLKQEENIKTENKADYEIWYIDIGGRVYKSWRDYVENNNLPKCTMVLPKDGLYQADVSYPVTEDYSTVWVEIIESPACTLASAICNGVDIVSSIAGLGVAGLSAVGMVTPLAPVVVITGIAAAGISSIWTIGRSSQQLVDRAIHEESNLDKEALPHWLSIFGTTFGLAAVGGSAALSRAVGQGKTIPTFVKAVFNTVQGGNIVFNGAGVIYQGYDIVDKYMTESQIDRVGMLNFAIHVMFFASTVVKIQFANDIINNTQVKIINDYKETLRKKNLRKKFNRVARKAAANNTCKISENADVINYIRHREQISANQSVNQSANQPVNQSVTHGQINNIQSHIVWSYEQGKLKVNGVILFEPIEYVVRLMKSDIFNEIRQNNPSSQNNGDNDIADSLKEVFSDLLSKFYASDACPKSKNLPLLPDFEPLLKDMSSVRINTKSLKKLFIIVEKLMRRSRNKDDFLFMAFILVWQYCKANLEKWGIYTKDRIQSNSGSDILQRIIITAVWEAIDMILDNLCSAFVRYIEINLIMQVN